MPVSSHHTELNRKITKQVFSHRGHGNFGVTSLLQCSSHRGMGFPVVVFFPTSSGTRRPPERPHSWPGVKQSMGQAVPFLQPCCDLDRALGWCSGFVFFSSGDDTFKWAGRTNRNLHASQVFSGFKRRHAVIQIKAGDKKAQILLVQILVFLPLLVYVPLLSQCCDLAWQCRVGERAEDTWKYLICHRLAMLPPPPKREAGKHKKLCHILTQETPAVWKKTWKQ